MISAFRIFTHFEKLSQEAENSLFREGGDIWKPLVQWSVTIRLLTFFDGGVVGGYLL
jgi:hypothetical protein